MIGTTEILLIVGAIVLLFGGSQLPKLAKALGRFVKDFNESKAESNKPKKE